MYGCQTGTKCLIRPAKQDQSCPTGFSVGRAGLAHFPSCCAAPPALLDGHIRTVRRPVRAPVVAAPAAVDRYPNAAADAIGLSSVADGQTSHLRPLTDEVGRPPPLGRPAAIR
jgi:hypothetical protein